MIAAAHSVVVTMSSIDIVKRIANTEEGRQKIGLPDEKIQVSKEDNGFAFIHSGGYVFVSKSDIETTIIRDILVEMIPDDYKIEMTQKKTPDKEYSFRCAVYSTRNHHMISFAYGKSNLEATGKCLLDILKSIKNKEDSYGEFS